MEDYKSNSHRSKEIQEKHLEKSRKIKTVAKGNAVKKKGGFIKKLIGTFMAEDMDEFKSDLIVRVVVPKIVESIEDGISLFFRGEAGRSSRRGAASKVSYRKYYEDSDRNSEQRAYRHRTGDFDDIGFDYASEAEAVLEMLDEILSEYGFVTVADMYEMADMSAPYTAQRYGWKNINGARIIRDRGGKYVIRMPRAIAID